MGPRSPCGTLTWWPYYHSRDPAEFHRWINVAKALSQKGIEFKVIDPRALVLLGETVIKSVEKTGRLVVVLKDAHLCDGTAEIVAAVAEHVSLSLHVP